MPKTKLSLSLIRSLYFISVSGSSALPFSHMRKLDTSCRVSSCFYFIILSCLQDRLKFAAVFFPCEVAAHHISDYDTFAVKGKRIRSLWTSDHSVFGQAVNIEVYCYCLFNV